jgi:hypothetical protein
MTRTFLLSILVYGQIAGGGPEISWKGPFFYKKKKFGQTINE